MIHKYLRNLMLKLHYAYVKSYIVHNKSLNVIQHILYNLINIYYIT